MASYHLSVKSGKKGRAAEHGAYIARVGKHGKGKEDVVALEHGNLPAWANNDPAYFWRMADKYERANGSTYRELEIALPRELTLEQNLDLLKDLIHQEVGEKPYQVAIHNPQAALGDADQPHGHIMVSDRVPDQINRPPEQHFRRYNPAHPERGGCRKDSGGKEPAALREELKSLRARCAELQNIHLEKHGHSARVDHRSNRDRGITKERERHLGSAAIQNMTQDEIKAVKRRRSSK